MPSAIQPLAEEYVIAFESPDPKNVYAYSPGLCHLDSGRLVATIDIGGAGVVDLPGVKYHRGDPGRACQQGKVFTSDDHGKTWQHRTDFPFMHARPFSANDALYVIGHAGDLMIMRSDDGGTTWNAATKLTDGQVWHQAPCNVHYANGCVYLVMERRVTHDIQAWSVGELAPVLLRGNLDVDLTQRDNWTFASELSFRDVIPGIEQDPAIDYFGVPFFDAPYPKGCFVGPGRDCAPMGWLETNVVQFVDPHHTWCDPSGKTFHLWARAHTGGTGYACITKVTEQGDTPGTGAMITGLETVPSGKHILYIPCPGGQMKFHIVYDGQSQLYWLLSTQARDSMIRPADLPANRFNLPNNERRRLQLHFSKNMVDWCFAGLVATGPVENASRHYASMVIDGADLIILSRSGDERARSAHDGNLITFHRVAQFRDLIY